MKNKNEVLSFKINTPAFLNELVTNLEGRANMGVLFVPLNVFRLEMVKISNRCAELNDPVLNKIMCDMALYEQSDPTSKEYNKKMVEQVNKIYKDYIKISTNATT